MTRREPTDIERINMFIDLWTEYKLVMEHIGTTSTVTNTHMFPIKNRAIRKSNNTEMLVRLAFLRKFFAKDDSVRINKVIVSIENVMLSHVPLGSEEELQRNNFLKHARDMVEHFNESKVASTTMRFQDGDHVLTVDDIHEIMTKLVYGRVLHADVDKYNYINDEGEIYQYVSAFVSQMQQIAETLWQNTIISCHLIDGSIFSDETRTLYEAKTSH
jgi:hypothetical protein